MMNNLKNANGGDVGIEISALKTNEIKNPIGIDVTPRFSWMLNSSTRGAKQTAYHIIVCSTASNAAELLADIWDSGKTESAKHFDIVYKGSALQSKTEYFWRVKVFDGGDNPTQWSETAIFETGIFDNSEWGAKWICRSESFLTHTEATPDPGDADLSAQMFRKEFAIEKTDKTIAKARAYICGLGIYVLKINGKEPDDSVLNLTDTQYEKTLPYAVYDVGDMIKTGANAIGIELGNGFWNELTSTWYMNFAPWRDVPMLIFRLDVAFDDGTIQTIASDETWKATNSGPTVKNQFFAGEIYDARKEMDGWTQSGFDDSDWKEAAPCKFAAVNTLAIPGEIPAGKLRHSYIEPMRRVKSYRPSAIEKLREGAWMVKIPEVTTGWMRLRIKAKSGTEIKISYGEQRDGDAVDQLKYMDNQGFHKIKNVNPSGAIQKDIYITRGEKTEYYEPRFSYKCFQWIHIAGYPGVLTEDDIECYKIYSDVDVIGKFECGDEFINRLHRMAQNAILNNIQGKTSEPAWEKLGWTGDINLALRTMALNIDFGRYIRYYQDIMGDSITEDGLMPLISPATRWAYLVGNQIVWNSLYITIAQQMEDFYGTCSLTEAHYDSLRKQVLLYMSDSRDKYNHTWSDAEMGDWIAPTNPQENKSQAFVPEGSAIAGSFYLYQSLLSMEKLALSLGKTSDADEYLSARKNLTSVFNERFLKKDHYETGTWNSDYEAGRTLYRQTSNILPFAMGVVPDDMRDAVLANLVADVKAKDYHFDAGIMGSRFILPVLAENGHADVAMKILKQSTYPSWGFFLSASDANSTWEVFELNCRSCCHLYTSTYDEWLFEYIAGIRDVSNGFESFTLKPIFFKELGYVRAELDTVRGKLVSKWEIDSNNRILYNAAIPVGSVAQIILPSADISDISEITDNIEGIYSVESVKKEAGYIKITVGSGNYSFLFQ